MFTNLNALERELTASGLHGALIWLNRRVKHRFTAVYLLQKQTLQLVDLVDKLGEQIPDRLFSVPLGASFCELTLRDGKFITTESVNDPRLDGHPAQHRVRSYVGLPVHRGIGELFGTFCHFDFDPQKIDDAEFAFLQDAVTFLSPYVKVHHDDVMKKWAD